MSEDEFAGCEAYPDGIPRQSCTARSTTSRPTPVDQGLTYLPRDPEARWTSPEGPSETSWVADGLQQTSADAPAGSTKGRSERRKRPRRCSRGGVLPPHLGGLRRPRLPNCRHARLHRNPDRGFRRLDRPSAHRQQRVPCSEAARGGHRRRAGRTTRCPARETPAAEWPPASSSGRSRRPSAGAGLTRLHRSDAEGPHHLVVLMLDDVTVPCVLAGLVELGADARDLAGVRGHGVFEPRLP